MLKKPLLLNGALVIVSGMLIYNMSQMWLSSSPPPKADELAKGLEVTKTLLDKEKKQQRQATPPGSYDVVGKQNLFRPQRREWKPPPPPPPAPPKPPPVAKTEPEPIPPPPLPDPAVMGIILEEDGERIAIMQGHHREEIKVRSRRRGRMPSRIVADRVKSYHEGDTISEAIILEIQENKVIIEREGNRIELALGNKASEQRASPSARSPARRRSPTPSPYKRSEVSAPPTYGQPDAEQPPPLLKKGLSRSERLQRFKASRRERLRRRLRYPLPEGDD